jgi:hypothetical protein
MLCRSLFVLFLLVIVLSVLLRFTDSDYTFKLFLSILNYDISVKVKTGIVTNECIIKKKIVVFPLLFLFCPSITKVCINSYYILKRIPHNFPHHHLVSLLKIKKSNMRFIKSVFLESILAFDTKDSHNRQAITYCEITFIRGVPIFVVLTDCTCKITSTCKLLKSFHK